MKHWRTLSIAVAAALALCLSAPRTHAEEQKAAAAQPAAPADKAEAAKNAEGCSADGSCCGTGACPQMKAMAESGDAGGCPCQKAKQQQQKQ
jgi:hypothetical protein